MPDRDTSSRFTANESPVKQSSTPPAYGSVEHIRRLAELVATGEVPVPADLDRGQLRRLLAEVARHRRDRLVRYIARAIAMDIHQADERGKAG